MYWLTDIILKELKLGFAEATVLEALHPVRSFSLMLLVCDDRTTFLWCAPLVVTCTPLNGTCIREDQLVLRTCD